jgi:hypothetical protein
MFVSPRVGRLKLIDPAIIVDRPNEISHQARPTGTVQKSGDAGHVPRREIGVAVAECCVRRWKS